MMKEINTEELYEIYLKNPIISKDTRYISKGCIYLSLKGESFDGNKFAKEAIEKGAAFAIIDDPEYKIDERFLLVENSLKALQDLATFHRNQLKIPIIAISGSNGKTTTKELIAATLSKKYEILFTEGNYNNHIGVPLTLLRIRPSHEMAIIEMGANHQGEIDFMCKIAKPNYGLLTNIGKAHLEGFGGVEGIVKGKTELYRYLENQNGTTFINLNDSKLAKNILSNSHITYGIDKISDCKGKIEETHPKLKGLWKSKNQSGIIESSLYGAYNFSNILAACCIADYFGVESNQIDQAILNYHSEINRSQLLKLDSNTIYLDAYNANPTSMSLSLENFNKVESENKIAILGDMFELGNESKKEHLDLIAFAKNQITIKQFVFIGANFYNLKEAFNNAKFFRTTEEGREWFISQQFKETTLLLKGSRGMKLESILKE